MKTASPYSTPSSLPHPIIHRRKGIIFGYEQLSHILPLSCPSLFFLTLMISERTALNLELTDPFPFPFPTLESFFLLPRKKSQGKFVRFVWGKCIVLRKRMDSVAVAASQGIWNSSLFLFSVSSLFDYFSFRRMLFEPRPDSWPFSLET